MGLLSREDDAKWKKLASEQGYEGRCTWCWRFYKKVLPGGMFHQCNDCGGGDIVYIDTGEPIMNDPGEPDREPWPKKGTGLYDFFIEDRENDDAI